jgi:hypothetical protein
LIPETASKTFNPDAYVIQDSRTLVGNYILFWRPNRSGYTCDLLQAGEYTKEEAERQHASRKTDIAHKISDLLNVVELHIDFQKLR